MKAKKPANIIKTDRDFQRNYSLHDRAEKEGIKILTSFDRYNLEEFGEDRRHEDVWEAGEDKPDIKIASNGNLLCYLDWKGKYSDWVCINERAYKSYTSIAKKLNKPIVIAMARFKKPSNDLISFKYYILPDDNLITRKTKSWDGNIVTHFDQKKSRDFIEINKFLDSLS
jgi:hypothetical protein